MPVRFTISGRVLALQPDIFAFTLLIQQNADGMSPHGELRLRALMSMDGSAVSPHALDSVNRGLLVCFSGPFATYQYGVVVVWVDTLTILQLQNDSRESVDVSWVVDYCFRGDSNYCSVMFVMSTRGAYQHAFSFYKTPVQRCERMQESYTIAAGGRVNGVRR
jgi:hypothetical protein